MSMESYVVVDHVTAGAPGHIAGLKVNDTIVAINDVRMFTQKQVISALTSNETVKVIINRMMPVPANGIVPDINMADCSLKIDTSKLKTVRILASTIQAKDEIFATGSNKSQEGSKTKNQKISEKTDKRKISKKERQKRKDMLKQREESIQQASAELNDVFGGKIMEVSSGLGSTVSMSFLLIDDVVKEGNAFVAGMQDYDLILMINEKPVHTISELRSELASLSKKADSPSISCTLTVRGLPRMPSY